MWLKRSRLQHSPRSAGLNACRQSRFARTLLRIESLEERLLLSVAPEEQQFVYLLNRARHDPVAYQVENSLPVDLSYVTPRPPLAVNDKLFSSAEVHSTDLAVHDYSPPPDHYSPYLGKYPNRLVRDQGYVLAALFSDSANNVESALTASSASYSSALSTLNALIVDAGVPSLGHRNHLLGIGSFNADNREIGVAHNAAPSNTTFKQFWAIHVTRTDPSDQFLTGVVFNDTNSNGRYDLNEGLPGVAITAGLLATTTNAAGGWSLPIVSGVYQVRASGGAFNGQAAVPVVVGNGNVEVDFVSGVSTGYVNFALYQNTAPTLAAGNRTLGPVLLNSANPPGDPVASIIGNTITDPDPLAVVGIAVVSADSSNGNWQFSIDGGSAWNSLNAASDSAARLLRDIDLVRFVPNAGFVGAASISYRGWDQTSGVAGGTANLTSGTGGSTPFSGGSAVSAVITVLAANTAPTLNPGNRTLTSILEDAANPPGDSIAALVGTTVSDSDPGARAGIAIVAMTGASSGSWQYSLDGGANWTTIVAALDSSARLLRSSDRIRFLPSANFSGSATITYRAWDQMTGMAGGTADLSGTGVTGGSTSFSVAIATANIAVAAVNDAPVPNPNTTLVLPAVPVNGPTPPTVGTVASWLGNTVTDVDSGAVQGIAVIGVTGNGTWWFNTGGWFGGGPPMPQYAVLLRSTDRIGFSPAAGWSGTASFTFRAWDRTTGAASTSSLGTWLDLSSSQSYGGTTAYSAATTTATVYVGTAGASISGLVFGDSDSSGSQNGAEVGLAGWTTFLDYDNDGQPSGNEPRTTSTADGSYTLTNLSPGTFRLRQVLLPNWQVTYPAGGTHSVTLSAGPSPGWNFGNVNDAPSLTIDNAPVVEGNSTTGAAFTVLLSKVAAQPVTVAYATADGTATTTDGDYQASSGTLTFAAGTTSRSITVQVNGDAKFELDETFTVNLSSAGNATIAAGTGNGTIQNDDLQPTIGIGNLSFAEGNSGIANAMLSVTLSNPSFQQVTVAYTTSDGTATTADGDYQATSGTLTFAADSTSQNVTVQVNGDNRSEPNETFTVNLSSAGNATIGSGTGAGTIQNDDPQPTIGIGNLSFAEGNSGMTDAVFSVNLSNPSFQQVTVAYATADGTATTADGDYQASSGTLTFAAGSTSQNVTVQVNGNAKFELDETFTVNLSSAGNATIAAGTGNGTIQNDDLQPTIGIGNLSFAEGNSGMTNAMLSVTLSNPSFQQVTVAYTTSNGTATTSDGDHQATSGTLTFAAGTTGQSITVHVNGDSKFEPDETFTINLSSPGNATIAAGTGNITIQNDDLQPTIGIGNLSVAEGNSGIANAMLSVTLSNPSFQQITVAYATADGTATTADGDHQATSGTLTFAAGSTSQSITVHVNGDTKFEPDETFTINLSSPGNAAIASGTGNVTIQNDDLQPTIGIGNLSVAEGAGGMTNAMLSVNLSNPSFQQITVAYGTADGTATTADSDYHATSGTLTFAAGTTSQSVTVQVNGDNRFEPDETFQVNLTSPANATLDASQGIGTIANDDLRWHNANRPADVDGDTHITTIDLIHAIDSLNTYGGVYLPTVTSPPTRFVDVDGDDSLSSIDLVLVVDALNSAPPTLTATSSGFADLPSPSWEIVNGEDSNAAGPPLQQGDSEPVALYGAIAFGVAVVSQSPVARIFNSPDVPAAVGPVEVSSTPGAPPVHYDLVGMAVSELDSAVELLLEALPVPIPLPSSLHGKILSCPELLFDLPSDVVSSESV